MTQITLGQTDHGALNVDLAKLVVTRGLVTASSGSGKSWLLRLIAERAAGKVQIIILDPEGEFATLREKLDILLVGEGGELALDLRSARLLARKLVELHASAVIDLSSFDEWKPRRAWAAEFLDGLMAVPKALWHPILIPIDEAHMLCPENAGGTKADDPVLDSRRAVNRLMSAGRKRGFCGLLASQRVSKLDKDAIAECKNIWIGGTTLDIDQQRAADILGIGKAERVQLRDLEPGEFYCFGPAVDGKGVQRFMSGQVATTHPKVGGHQVVKVPRASDAVRKIADALADLPAEVQRETDALAAAERRITDLKRQMAQLAARPTPVAPMAPAQPRVIESRVEIPVFRDGEVARLEAAVSVLAGVGREFASLGDRLVVTGQGVTDTAGEVGQALRAVIARPAPQPAPMPRPQIVTTTRPAPARPAPAQPAPRPVITDGEAKLTKAERKILTVLAQRGPRTKRQLAVQTGYSIKGGGFNNVLGSLSTAGRMLRSSDLYTITDQGVADLGSFEPLPTGQALLAYWIGQLKNKAARSILEVVAGVWPEEISKEDVAVATGYEVTGGGFNNGLGLVRTLEIISGSKMLRAADEMFLK